jgi:hypothetical protein
MDLYRKVGLNKLIDIISYIWGEFSQDRNELCMVAEGTHTHQKIYFKKKKKKKESKEPTEEQRQLGYHARRLQLPPFVELATT